MHFFCMVLLEVFYARKAKDQKLETDRNAT